jgi:hypothetical protein
VFGRRKTPLQNSSQSKPHDRMLSAAYSAKPFLKANTATCCILGFSPDDEANVIPVR